MTVMVMGLIFMLALFGVTASVAYWAGGKFPDFSLAIWAAAAVLCLAVLAGWIYWTFQGRLLGFSLGLALN